MIPILSRSRITLWNALVWCKMNSVDLYTYAQGDLLYDRNVYSYSPFHGSTFLNAWEKSRATAELNSKRGRNLILRETPTLSLIRSVRSGIHTPERDVAAWRDLDRLVQRFEVTKRVHDDYTKAWRAADKTQFHSMPAYVELAETFAWAYKNTDQLTYLNVLLKILDTLSTLLGDLPNAFKERVHALIADENAFVESLKITVRAKDTPKAEPLPPVPAGGTDMSNTIFLACPSARSRTYLEALCHYGMAPREVLVMGEESDTMQGPQTQSRYWNGIFLPDLRKSLQEICREKGIRFTVLPERNVNAAATLAALSVLEADYVIYSGVGGQIVSEDVIKVAPPLLHMHSGWLPYYRGSTTFYYAMLNRDLPSVSAILLDTGIDTGPVLRRQSYPMPDRGMDVDMVYDPAIRADLMCRTLPQLLHARNVKPELIQVPEKGTTYYEIHPVLKHIALLSLAGEPI